MVPAKGNSQTTHGIGLISAALLCLVHVPPQKEHAFRGGVRAPFPNSGW